MTCAQCRDLLFAYLTGDVTPAEQEAVRAHLAGGCPECIGALAEEQATFALIGLSIDPIDPPPGAKDRLMARVRGTPMGGDRVDGDRVDGDRGAALRPDTVTRRPAGRRWAALLATAACLALAAMVGWHVTQRRDHARRVAALKQVVTDRETRLAQLQSLVTTNQLTLIALGGQAPQPGASGRVFWDRDRGRWHVFVFDMKPPPPGKEYELWFITPGQKKVPAGTFGVDARGDAELVVQLPPDLGPVALAAVTDEPAGGSPQPTGAIQLVGEVK